MTDTAKKQTVQRPVAASPELQRLDVFLGTWRSEGPAFGEGKSNETIRASSTLMKLEETVEWLPGGFFLSRRWDGVVGENAFRGLEIVGYDDASGSYSSRFFDDQGNCPVYRVTEHEGAWTYAGDAQRATFKVDEDGAGVDVNWEWLKDGTDWRPLCALKSVRLQMEGARRPEQTHEMGAGR